LPWRRQRCPDGFMWGSAPFQAVNWPGQFVRAVSLRFVLGTRPRGLGGRSWGGRLFRAMQ
jgi:hypothetical protein